eukprot:gene394-716_t
MITNIATSFGVEIDVLSNQVQALVLNVYSWVRSYLPKAFRPKELLPETENVCVVVKGPGGLDRLQFIDIPGENTATVGYNVPGFPPPFANLSTLNSQGSNLVVVRNLYFSVNFADIAIRWGLYESALRYVGWPIVPGFDIAGIVEWSGPDSNFKVGDKVFGFTLFGAYSSRILVPSNQIRLIPNNLTLPNAAAISAVAGTALHAIALAGAYPQPILTRNKAALVHSAAGGVGSMLIQMCKLRGFSPVIAVVGSSHKVDTCKKLGADAVVDKSKENLWKALDKHSPSGYVAIFDANGVETLQDSYNRLTRCGRLIIYGFHTNLPKASHMLSPLQWMKMIYKLIITPKYNPMSLVVDSKAVLGFNLSFFADENETIHLYMTQLLKWLGEGVLEAPTVSLVDMKDIRSAHEMIQSGNSVGKIVIKVPTTTNI